MYVSRLCIKNFRNFGPNWFEIALKPSTLIVGENNIGKTNLLLALALIFRHDYVSVQSRNLQLEDFNYSVVQNFRNQVADANVNWSDIDFPSIEVRASLTDFTTEQQAVVGDWFSNQDCKEASLTYSYRLRPSFNSEKWILEQRTRHQQHGNAALIQLPVDDYRATITGGHGAVECDAYLLKTLRLEVLDALRDAKRELTAGEGRVLYRVLKQASSGNYQELENYLASLQETIAKNASLNIFKSEIGTVLEKVSLVEQSADNSVDFRFFSPNTDDLLAKIALIYGADPVSVERNGLGRNNLLFLGLLISQLCKPSANPSDTDNYVGFRIMGVEEPEAHLHPHLQEHLASNLEQLRQSQDKQLQLLLTSHSTHISSKMDLENTVVVYRDRASGQLRSHYVLQGLDRAKGLKIKRFLSLYLDATKSKMLFARLLILVEGIAEQTLVPQLFKRKYGQTLESIGCTIVNVQGLAFRPFLEVVRNGYFTKCVVITDLDSEVKDGDERGQKLKDDFAEVPSVSVHITSETTFEKDLIAANLIKDSRAPLWQALEMTRPKNGPQLKSELKEVVDMPKFFALIKDHKAAFAFHLAGIINDPQVHFQTPTYLDQAFEFLKGTNPGG